MAAEYVMKDKMLVVAITGEIDHHETKSLRVEIDAKIEQCAPETVVFDLSRTSFMDSSGLGLILGRYRRASAAGVKIEVVNPGEKIYRILTMAGIDKLITVKGVEK
jgi:stage II sporulation protein AA (anti-sigma F factor antagonist)